MLVYLLLFSYMIICVILQSVLSSLLMCRLPSTAHRKRKVPETETPEKETRSGTSESQIDM